nr:hypothetical protein [uncultured Albidiferax sp.]
MANIGWGHVMAAAVGGYLNGQQIGQRQLDAEEEKKAKAEDRGKRNCRRLAWFGLMSGASLLR